MTSPQPQDRHPAPEPESEVGHADPMVMEASADGDAVVLDLRLVVAPQDGRFHPATPRVVTAEGEVVHSGDVIGHVVRSGNHEPIHTFCAGFLMRLLADPGEHVRVGQPVALIHPVSV